MDTQGELAGRLALVTGVSRRVGIAWTIARRLAASGADVLATGWWPHDVEQPWGADDLVDEQSNDSWGASSLATALADGLPEGSGRIVLRSDDLSEPATPDRIVGAAADQFGTVPDLLLMVHARSSQAALAATTAQELDLSWAVNVRSTLLLIKAAARGWRDGRRLPRGGRVVLFTSGQHHGPMPGELAYVATKGAVQQVTATLAAELAPLRVTVNCVDPGPVDTGYAAPSLRARVANSMPFGRWGVPGDTADLIGWLVSDAGGWMTGQTLVTDGGWSLI